MHWGVEDSNSVSSDQISTAQELNDLGVDIVIGTGPHVLQKTDILTNSTGKKTVVWYSLGNFLSSQLKITELIGGVAHMTATKENNKITISDLSFDPTYMHYEWTAAQAASSDLLSRRNAMIYPLKESAEPLSKSLLNTTVTAQQQYVSDTIGALVSVGN
jgi:poly-gamma-glutamate synthesis protein (capsule biosynthesis protein)